MSKRLEELKKAEARLTKLVQAAVEVCNDSIAADSFREAASVHGTVVISADDAEHRAVMALALVKRALVNEGYEKSPTQGAPHV